MAFVLALATSLTQANELFDDLDFNALSNQFEERTFVSLNSTYIAYGVAAGAVLVLTFAAGLYLYDYFYNPARSDKVNTEPQIDYSQYYTDQEAYNQYLYQQAAAENYRRCVFCNICTTERHSEHISKFLNSREIPENHVSFRLLQLASLVVASSWPSHTYGARVYPWFRPCRKIF